MHVACLGGQGFLTLSGYRRDEVLGRCSYDLPCTGCRERTHHAKRQKHARLSNHLLLFNMLKQCPNFPNPTSGRFSELSVYFQLTHQGMQLNRFNAQIAGIVQIADTSSSLWYDTEVHRCDMCVGRVFIKGVNICKHLMMYLETPPNVHILRLRKHDLQWKTETYRCI
jgi:fructose-1,6-bisphosphatase/inositol monophosphatase family enzyme